MTPPVEGDFWLGVLVGALAAGPIAAVVMAACCAAGRASEAERRARMKNGPDRWEELWAKTETTTGRPPETPEDAIERVLREAREWAEGDGPDE